MSGSAVRLTGGTKRVSSLTRIHDARTQAAAAPDRERDEERGIWAGWTDTLEAIGALFVLLIKGHDGRPF